MLMCHRVVLIIFLVFLVNHLSVGLPDDTGPHEMLSRTNNDFIERDVLDNLSSGSVESRGWKKTALPFLLGVVLKMTTVLPMISSLMTVIGGVALVASKLALVLSVGIAVHYYLSSKHHLQYYRHPVSHSAVYDPVLPVTPYPVSHRLSVQSS